MTDDDVVIEVRPGMYEGLWDAMRGMIEGAILGEKLGVIDEESPVGMQLMALGACVYHSQAGVWPTRRQLQSAIVGPEGVGRSN